MRQIIIICLPFLFILLLGNNASAEELKGKRIIIGFKEEINLETISDIPHELHHLMDSINAVSITVPLYAVDLIKDLPETQWVENDHVVNTKAQSVDWGYNDTVTTGTKHLKLTGAGVKIGIIDTGVNGSHEDLQIEGGISFVEDEAGLNDLNGHGTHVTGIIAAKNNAVGTVGIAPNAKIYAIKSLNKNGEGRQTDIIAGIEWAMQQQLDIINLSITTPVSSIALEKVIVEADKAGILLVAASGNDETGTGQVGTDIMYPARYPEVIGVGSVGKDHIKSTFSYKGTSLAYSAPGENILSTYENDYARLSGTSMATPYVSGVIALYKEAYPYMNVNQIKSKLAENVIDLGESGHDSIYGAGLIQSPDYYFSDLKTIKWYSNYVEYLVKQNLISGYPDKTFRPLNSVTREEATTMLGRILDLSAIKRESVFDDVRIESFGSGYIVSATDEGIINGYPDNTFQPKANITRGEVATIIQRAFDIPVTQNKFFNDVNSGSYCFEAVNALYQANIINGFPNNKFIPEQEISRSEFSTILAKVLNESYR